MAGNFNQVILMGNLTRDVELAHTGSNQAVAKFGLAINRYYTTASGEKREEVTFVDCEAWGRTGENIAKFFSKGRPIFVTGYLKLDQWNDKTDGSKRSKLKVNVDTFQFVGDKQGAGGGGPGGGGGGTSAGNDYGDSDSPAPRVQTRPQGGGRAPQPAAPEINEEDIPF